MRVSVDRPTREIGGCVMAYGDVAKQVSRWCGRPKTSVLALGVIETWILTRPIFGFSDTWQLVINTANAESLLLLAG